jgi:hypothetical protein
MRILVTAITFSPCPMDSPMLLGAHTERFNEAGRGCLIGENCTGMYKREPAEHAARWMREGLFGLTLFCLWTLHLGDITRLVVTFLLVLGCAGAVWLRVFDAVDKGFFKGAILFSRGIR